MAESAPTPAALSADPAGIVHGWIEVLPPGSFLVLTHLFDPGPDDYLHEYAVSCQARYLEALGSGWFRTREQIAGFFDGLRMVTPGLVQPGDWWPGGPSTRPESVAEQLLLAGVGWKPREPPNVRRRPNRLAYRYRVSVPLRAVESAGHR
ncbi:SAM-dependent methyltransferase [Nocardia fusca]|uniref:SAM-dependent methyltransferase n=1 Tax=Nocardia fusca TaxID=941183 RepID=UPI0037B001EB